MSQYFGMCSFARNDCPSSLNVYRNQTNEFPVALDLLLSHKKEVVSDRYTPTKVDCSRFNLIFQVEIKNSVLVSVRTLPLKLQYKRSFFIIPKHTLSNILTDSGLVFALSFPDCAFFTRDR